VETPQGQELAHMCLDFGYRFCEKVGDLTRLQIEFLVRALVQREEQLTQAKLGSEGIRRMIVAGE